MSSQISRSVPLEVTIYGWPDGSTFNRILCDDHRKVLAQDLFDAKLMEGAGGVPGLRQKSLWDWNASTSHTPLLPLRSDFVLRDSRRTPCAMLGIASAIQTGPGTGATMPLAQVQYVLIPEGGSLFEHHHPIRGKVLDVLLNYLLAPVAEPSDPQFIRSFRRSLDIGLPVLIASETWKSLRSDRFPRAWHVGLQRWIRQKRPGTRKGLLKQANDLLSIRVGDALRETQASTFMYKLTHQNSGLKRYPEVENPAWNMGNPWNQLGMEEIDRLVVTVALPEGEGDVPQWKLYRLDASTADGRYTTFTSTLIAQSSELGDVLRATRVITTPDAWWRQVDAEIVEGSPLFDIDVYHDLVVRAPVLDRIDVFLPIAQQAGLPLRMRRVA